jgi:hypothetical protein|tara:strand:- start:490 stop:702 length:213 start_codon:yes stop_codon:yes gene_type:complete
MLRVEQINTLSDFSNAIADYITEEYGDMTTKIPLNDEHRNILGSIINVCYDDGDSINNTASHIIDFIRKL